MNSPFRIAAGAYRSSSLRGGFSALCLAVFSVTLQCPQLAVADDAVSYENEVFPILQAYCIGCHTADEAQGGLVMESHGALMAGGDTGLAITAGAPGSSRLVLMLKGELDPVMPPEGEARPKEEEIEKLIEWIEDGASGPDGDMPVKRELRTPAISADSSTSRPVTAIAIAADGSKRAVARYGEVTILDRDDQVISKLSDELHKVNSIQFSRDGGHVLVSSGRTGAYGNAAIFDVTSGALIREFVGHRDVLYCAVYSPTEKLVATAGYDRDIVLWDASTGEPIQSLSGHNGAIFDLAFSPDGTVLVSACADETVKVWNVESGQRLDTLSQPEGEVFATAITADGKHILAGSADNRLRVWELRSRERPRINPIVATRFVDETPLVNFALTPDGGGVVVLSEGGNVKVMRTSDWNLAATLDPLGENGSDVTIDPADRTAWISMMNGQIAKREIPRLAVRRRQSGPELERVYLDLGEPKKLTESELRKSADSDPNPVQQITSGGAPLLVPRGSEITGVIANPAEADEYSWEARSGEVWAIDADAAEKSPIDTIVTILDESGDPVLRTRLQAVRDSYFTFRGKDSKQVGDFRLFNWEEMHLNDYLFAAGEVTRLWMYPRGPDSGYNVYPNEGNRWTYFGTTHTTHALGEPAYVVRPLALNEAPLANGLPVFDIRYENDDDPMRVSGSNSRLIFTAPRDGVFTVQISDTRGEGGEAFKYKLRLRPAAPGFKPSVSKANETLRRGSGREFLARVDRIDGYEGPVTFHVANLPPQLQSNMPLTIEQGQRFAVGTLWVDESAEAWEGKVSPEVIASAMVNGRRVERVVGSLGELTLGDRPKAIPSIHPIEGNVAENEAWTLQVHRGETVSARVLIRRQDDFTAEVSFGKEDSGRNTTHGVYVDNIGLNGLLVRANEDEREFYLTADPIAKPGKRTFFLTGNVDGKVTTHPIIVEVLP